MVSASSFVITVASTGIGRACVDELVSAGAQVWATVRADADELALKQAHGDAVRVLRMDLSDAESISRAGQLVCEAGPLHGLVNNAGVALPGPLEYLPLDVFRRQIEVNLTGQLAVTQAMLPALRKARERGEQARIVMVGSISGRIATPMHGAYTVSKFGLVGLADTLRAELAPAGIGVVLIEPGRIATPIWDRGIAAGDHLLARLGEAQKSVYAAQISAAQADAAGARAKGLPPEQAARVIVRALTGRNPRPRQLIGADARLAAAVTMLPFRLRYRLTAARR
jgi:NAD(P)-dependent dehydrogenase (short-subunit alcohol dehydrogenase family)